MHELHKHIAAGNIDEFIKLFNSVNNFEYFDVNQKWIPFRGSRGITLLETCTTETCRKVDWESRESRESRKTMIDIARFILDNGGDPKAEMPGKSTVFHEYCILDGNRNIDMMKLMLEYGADIHNVNSSGSSCYDMLKKNMHEYDCAGKMKLMKILVDHKKDTS